MTPQQKRYLLLDGYSSRARRSTIDLIISMGYKVSPFMRHAYIYHPKMLTRAHWQPIAKEMGVSVTLIWQTKRLRGKYLVKVLSKKPTPQPTITLSSDKVDVIGLGSGDIKVTVTDTKNVTVSQNDSVTSKVSKVSDTEYTLTITSLKNETGSYTLDITATGDGGSTSKSVTVNVTKTEGDKV